MTTIRVEGERRAVSDQPTASSFESFYRTHQPTQVRRAALLVGSAELADDIVHEAMIGVYRNWATVREPGAYLNRSVLNGCRDAGRRRVRQRRLLARIGTETVAPPCDPLDDALARLPFRQRAAVVLRYYEQRSVAEIAATLGCPTGSVGPWIDRALTTLRKALA